MSKEQCCGAYNPGITERLVCWMRRLPDLILEDRYLDCIGSVPNSFRNLTIVAEERPGLKLEIFAGFENDAFEFWLGKKCTERGHVDDRWKFSCRTWVFRQIALWYLWRWAWGEWFGLRRWLFYKNLHRKCEARRKR